MSKSSEHRRMSRSSEHRRMSTSSEHRRMSTSSEHRRMILIKLPAKPVIDLNGAIPFAERHAFVEKRALPGKFS